MNTHAEKSRELFLKGYNCAQAVVGAYAQDVNIDFDTLIKLSSSFGGGMGKLREVCGAVSGMFMIAGLLKGYDSPQNDEDKQKHYELIQQLAHEFKQNNQSIICRDLLDLQEKESAPIPTKRNDEFYKNRPCCYLVENACEILDKFIASN